MDPNAALLAILTGHMVDDHADALLGWLNGGGFAPSPVKGSDLHKLAAFVVRHCEATYGDRRATDITFTADAAGVWSASESGERKLIHSLAQLGLGLNG